MEDDSIMNLIQRLGDTPHPHGNSDARHTSSQAARTDSAATENDDRSRASTDWTDGVPSSSTLNVSETSSTAKEDPKVERSIVHVDTEFSTTIFAEEETPVRRELVITTPRSIGVLGTPLPPKQIVCRSRRRQNIEIIGVTVACLGICAGLIYGAFRVWILNGEGVFIPLENLQLPKYFESYPEPTIYSCDELTANGTELALILDIRSDPIFSFSQAKGIQIAWDLVVGQFGRFVHGWILWAFVVPDVLTRILEISAMPHSMILDLSFNTISVFAIWSALQSTVTGRRHKRRVIPHLIWLALAILYVLFYPTVWGAATGYVGGSTTVFPLPDGSYSQPLTDSLSLCYQFDGTRLGLDSSITAIGPTLKELAVHGWNATTRPLPGVSIPINTSSQFWDAFVYATNIRITNDIIDTSNQLYRYFDTNYTNGHYLPTAKPVPFYNYSAALAPISSRTPNTIAGLSLCATNQSNCQVLSPPRYPWGIFTIPHNNETEQYGFSSVSYRNAIGLYNSMGIINAALPVAPMNMTYNQSALEYLEGRSFIGGPSAEWHLHYGIQLAYSSTFWWEGQHYDVSAPTMMMSDGCYPLLDLIAGQSWAPGACLCHQGKALTYEFTNATSAACLTTDDDYQWGCSSYMTAIGLTCEVIWVFCCWCVWLDARLNSVLLRNGRKAGGTVRSVLDVAGRIQSDLGEDTVGYTEGELRRSLRGRGLVGHKVEREHEKMEVTRIGVLEERVSRRRWGVRRRQEG